MFEFKNKTILILSPNQWGTMKISKHHYAEELANKGNTVFFLNPPNLKKKSFEITKLHDKLFLIDYKPIFRGQRFLPEFLFNFLLKSQVKFIQKKINQPIDILWSFSSAIFKDLSYFNSRFKIFHPVDQLETKKEIKIAKNADIIFSVSSVIIKKLNHYKEKTFFINHGLAQVFAEEAKGRLNAGINYHKNNVIKVAYVGNLLIKSLDKKIFIEIIKQNPNVEFTIYGAYSINESNLSGYISEKTRDFIHFLKKSKNVVLKGSVSPTIISNELYSFDVLLLLINHQNDYNKASNSHKLLEYLSTGKVIVSNYVSCYKNKRYLLEMLDETDNSKLPLLLKKVINNLEYYNSDELQRIRIEYALDNTYTKQIQRIENIISKKLKNQPFYF